MPVSIVTVTGIQLRSLLSFQPLDPLHDFILCALRGVPGGAYGPSICETLKPLFRAGKNISRKHVSSPGLPGIQGGGSYAIVSLGLWAYHAQCDEEKIKYWNVALFFCEKCSVTLKCGKPCVGHRSVSNPIHGSRRSSKSLGSCESGRIPIHTCYRWAPTVLFCCNYCSTGSHFAILQYCRLQSVTSANLYIFIPVEYFHKYRPSKTLEDTSTPTVTLTCNWTCIL